MNEILQMIFDFVATVFKVLISCAVPFIFMFFVGFLFYRIKGVKAKRPSFKSKYKKRNIFIRLFKDFPFQLALDCLERNPDEFPDYGLHLFVGEQGSGKTVALAERLFFYKKRYPLAEISTNFYWTEQDDELTDWQSLIFRNNGIYGQIMVIDEIQNWFCSNQSKDFPPELIQEITQQRKQRKVMLATTQRFERMAKPLREQVNFIYYPVTLGGCLTIVKKVKPRIDMDGQIKKERVVKRYFFVHNKEIRDSFDTFRKVASMAKSGFRSERLPFDEPAVNVNVTVSQGKGARKG